MRWLQVFLFNIDYSSQYYSLMYLHIVKWFQVLLIFVSASHQIGHDTRPMTRRSIIVEIRGGEGRARAKAQALLDDARHRRT